MALFKQKIEAGQVIEINKEGRFIKVINCQSELHIRVFGLKGELVLDTPVRGGFDIKLQGFAKITIQASESQQYEIWADENALGYDALTKGSNTNQSGVIEHFGGSQKVLPFESNRVAVTLFSDTEPFWYGGQGVTVDNGIPVKAGQPVRIEGAGEMHIAINKKPALIASQSYSVLNNRVFDESEDYGVNSFDSNAMLTTAKAIYFIENIVAGTSNINAMRASKSEVQGLTRLGHAIDMVVTDYNNDEIAVLLKTGEITIYREGIETGQVSTLQSHKYWRKLGYDGVKFYALCYESTGVTGFDKAVYAVDDVVNPAFFTNKSINKFLYDEYSGKMLAITSEGATNDLVDLTDANGQMDSFPYALGRSVSAEITSTTYVRFFANDTHIVINNLNGALIYNRQSNQITFTVDGEIVIPLGGGLIYAITTEAQKVSYDNGVSFQVVDTIDLVGGSTFLATITDTNLIVHPKIADDSGFDRVRSYDTQVLKADAFAQIRMLKEVV